MLSFLNTLNGMLPIDAMLSFFIRIVAAGLCGVAIGYERSKRFKESGIRTHCLVGLSAALMMIISKYAFVDLGEGSGYFAGTRGADASRIAAQVVSGVSFLGAGVIFKDGKTIRGLTTSAAIWVTAGVGLAIGAGMYLVGLFVTLFVLAMMFLMHRFTLGGDSFLSGRLHITVLNGTDFQTILDAKLKELGAMALENGVVKCGDEIMFDLLLKIPSKGDVFQSLVRFLGETECVTSFNASHERE